jgi:hypothetical protein
MQAASDSSYSIARVKRLSFSVAAALASQRVRDQHVMNMNKRYLRGIRIGSPAVVR